MKNFLFTLLVVGLPFLACGIRFGIDIERHQRWKNLRRIR